MSYLKTPQGQTHFKGRTGSMQRRRRSARRATAMRHIANVTGLVTAIASLITALAGLLTAIGIMTGSR